VRLDLDRTRLEADERVGERAREHCPTVSRRIARMGRETCSKSDPLFILVRKSEVVSR
jgi:hypothetical protein